MTGHNEVPRERIPSDPHPLIDLNELARETQALERSELGAEVAASAVDRIGEQVRPILDEEMGKAYPEYAAATTPEARAEIFNRIRLSGDPKFKSTMQAVAARVTTETGLSDQSLAQTFNVVVAGATETIQGAGEDLQGFSGEQWLTVALMGGGGYLLGGENRRGWALGLGGLTAMVQSQHLTQGAIAVGGGALKTVGYAALVGPLQLSIRGVEAAGEALSGDWNGVQAQGEGVLNDWQHNISDILGQDGRPRTNPMVQDFLEEHRDTAPEPLRPLLNYMYALRAGDFENLEMVTQAQLIAAGQYLRQTEYLVDEQDYWRLEAKVVNGELNDTAEKQQYVLMKFHMMVRGTFMADQDTPENRLMQQGYDQAAAAALLTLDQALPPANVASINLNLSDEQIRALESHPLTAEVIGQKLFSSSGAGSRTLAVAYLYFMMMGPIVKGVRGVLFPETGTNTANDSNLILDEQPLSSNVPGRNPYSRLATLVAGGGAMAVYGRLKSHDILFAENRALEQAIRDNARSIDFNTDEFKTFRELLGDESQATKGEIRTAFLTGLKSVNGMETAVETAERLNNLLLQLRKMDHFRKNGSGEGVLTVNGSSYTLTHGTSFTDNLRSMTNLLTLRNQRDWFGKSFYLRGVQGGVGGQTKSIKVSITNDGRLVLYERVDRAIEANPVNYPWTEIGEINELSFSS